MVEAFPVAELLVYKLTRFLLPVHSTWPAWLIAQTVQI